MQRAVKQGYLTKSDKYADKVIEDEDEDEPSRPVNQIMNSVDFAKMQFDSIGFKRKWLDFIGDPAQGFTAMVFGKPKMGKSYLCIDFAGYLARNHGKVLYWNSY